MRLSELLEEYVLYARAANRSEHTITSQRYHLRRFLLFLESQDHSTDCGDITPRIVREFIARIQETYAPKTVANNVRALKTLFALGVEEELVDTNPLRRIPVPSVPLTDFDVFQPSDIEILIRACNRDTLTGLRDAVIVLTLFDSGIRASELVKLTDEDVDWQRGVLTVFGKGSKARGVPVSARTLRAIRRYINKRNKAGIVDKPALFVNNAGDALTASGLLQLLKRLGKRTGLHVHPHALRHAYAVNALRNGAREFDIQGCLGHTTLVMTRHYARQSVADLAEAHKRFSPADKLAIRV